MIKVIEVNGASVYRHFKNEATGSLIYLSELRLHARHYLHFLAVKKNFSKVIFINPSFSSPAINVFVSELAQAHVPVFVISNQKINRAPRNQEEEKQELNILDLLESLPNRAICRLPINPLEDLVEELQLKLPSGKTLIVCNFSFLSFVAGLKILGFSLPAPKRESSRNLVAEGIFKKQPLPHSEVIRLINGWAEDKKLKEIGGDRTKQMEFFLEGLLIN